MKKACELGSPSLLQNSRWKPIVMQCLCSVDLILENGPHLHIYPCWVPRHQENEQLGFLISWCEEQVASLIRPVQARLAALLCLPVSPKGLLLPSPHACPEGALLPAARGVLPAWNSSWFCVLGLGMELAAFSWPPPPGESKLSRVSRACQIHEGVRRSSKPELSRWV